MVTIRLVAMSSIIAAYGAHSFSTHPPKQHQHSLAAMNEQVNTNVEQESSNSILMISWERCLADTVRHRSECALEAARRVWPSLYDTFCDDTEWLFVKLHAIHHVLDGPAEYGLAVRCVLEEQILDGGHSNGKTGKYASLYHPQRQGGCSVTATGTRPLTVGEITAHWKDDLRDTLRFRYGPPDPSEALEQATRNVMEETQPKPFRLHTEALRLHSAVHIITVRYEMDLPIASASLDDAGVDHVVVTDNTELEASLLLDQKSSPSAKPRAILVLDDKSDTLQRLVELAPTLRIDCVEASYDRLQSYTELCDDDAHRQRSRLRLHLASWATHPDEVLAATMNPWTDTIDLGVVSQNWS